MVKSTRDLESWVLGSTARLYEERPIVEDLADLEPWEELVSKYYYTPNNPHAMGGLRGIGPRGLTDAQIEAGAIEQYQDRMREEERERDMAAYEYRMESRKSLHE